MQPIAAKRAKLNRRRLDTALDLAVTVSPKMTS
jgi:hypothetical protein